MGESYFSQRINKNVYEKVNPKTQKHVKNIKGTCNVCARNKSQVFTNHMINKQTETNQTKRDKILQKPRKCKNNHSSPMSILSWRDLNIEGNLLKVYDKCPNPRSINKSLLPLINFS